MSLTHPKDSTTRTRNLSIPPIFELEGSDSIPRHELPAGDMPGDVAYQIEYDVVETNSERNGGFCNVHFGTTNTHTGAQNFAGDPTQWHTYACELNSEGVVFYLDGNVTKTKFK